MVHERFTAPAIDHLLSELETSDFVSDRHGDAAVNVRETRRAYDRARKLPGSLVEEMSRTEVLAQQVWGEARGKSDFAMFRPWLDKWVDLKRQEAECVGYKSNPYDALLDQFEPGETAAGGSGGRLNRYARASLVELVARIVDCGRKALRRNSRTPLPRRRASTSLRKNGVGGDWIRLFRRAGSMSVCIRFVPGLGQVITHDDAL